MVWAIKRVEGSDETQDVEFGRVCRWCSECVVFECDCGERLILIASSTICGRCAVDQAGVVQEETATRQPKGDDVPLPWRYDRSSEDTGMSFLTSSRVNHRDMAISPLLFSAKNPARAA